MIQNRLRYQIFMMLLCVTYTYTNAFAANPIPDPCGGPTALINLIDRPTKSDSACVVPYHQVILEMGYQYLNISGGGSSQNFPEAELRIGLPWNNEFVILPPNYNHQNISPHSGYDATTIGVKHELGYNEHWLGAIEALVGLPTGGNAFGSNKYQPLVNGIIEYTFNSSLSLDFMLGVGSQSVPPAVGGQRYFTINPDMVLTWQVTNIFQAYGEVYGQSRTAPGKNAGFAGDIGVVYLLTQHVTVDASLGQRISNNLGGFNHYVGVGAAFLFD